MPGKKLDWTAGVTALAVVLFWLLYMLWQWSMEVIR